MRLHHLRVQFDDLDTLDRRIVRRGGERDAETEADHCNFPRCRMQ